MVYFAHTKEDAKAEEWQLLSEHLLNVGNLAGAFAAEFDSKDMGSVSGLLHDAGKYSISFQKRLFGESFRVDHSTAGAKIAFQKYELGKLLAYVICGHHGGIPDGIAQSGMEGSLLERLEKNIENFDEYFNEMELPEKLANKRLNRTKYPAFSVAFYIRMLFSTLVDADFLDTEHFIKPDKARLRRKFNDFDKIKANYQKYINTLNNKKRKSEIMKERVKINDYCVAASQQEQGIFSLTVPTGGGKTLSSFAFALRHLEKHKLNRIIYAIPYTSIIEQNAKVFKEALGENVVLEHHSNIDYDKYNDTEKERIKLASENWDAPFVVTTNVQFFESLFSNKPSKCRKLHNLTNSVVILDEVQTIPDELLQPCLAALQCLVRDYGVTVLLCTATQPALEFAWPEEQTVKEIIPDPEALYEQFKRVEVINLGVIEDDEIQNRLFDCHQALCIVNTRKRAKLIYDSIRTKENSYHLSTLMCPEHRSQIIKKVKDHLRNGEECTVVSTQLIEAGVDIDFPIVFREIAGIDSVAQAAGRCNREGRQKIGKVYVYQPTENLPRGWFQRMAELGKQVMNKYDDVLSIEAIHSFFQKRYQFNGVDGLDKYKIINRLDISRNEMNFPFQSVAEDFTFINNPSNSVVVLYDDLCRKIVGEMKKSENVKYHINALQRYMVNVYSNELKWLNEKGYINNDILPCPVLDVMETEYENIYKYDTGLEISEKLPTYNL